jgi:hypothetical protein
MNTLDQSEIKRIFIDEARQKASFVYGIKLDGKEFAEVEFRPTFQELLSVLMQPSTIPNRYADIVAAINSIAASKVPGLGE